MRKPYSGLRFVGAIPLAAIILAGCNHANTESADPSSSAGSALSSTSDPAKLGAQKEDAESLSRYASMIEAPSSEIADNPVASAPKAGSCGNLAVDNIGGRFNSSDCDNAAYRVYKVVEMPSQCPTDSDQRSYFGERSTFYTLCLDVNWKKDRCVEYAAISKVVPCSGQPSKNTVRPVRVIFDSIDAKLCNTGGALPHNKRRFVVCVDSATA